MAFGLKGWPKPVAREKTAHKWASLAESLRKGGHPPARPLRDEAASLYRELGSFLQLSDPRAIRARGGLAKLINQPGTDWRWRSALLCGPVASAGLVEPEAGETFGDEIAVWHDCAHRALLLRQMMNRHPDDQAPFGLRLEVMGFSGSYLSLSLDLPEDVLHELGKDHILRLEIDLEAETAITVYGRLNLVQGPNTEQVLRQLGDPISRDRCRRVAEYDLAYADLSERPIEKVWLDLIFAEPYMNAVTVSDMVLSRYPRAEL